jgi:hypothetical protein
MTVLQLGPGCSTTFGAMIDVYGAMVDSGGKRGTAVKILLQHHVFQHESHVKITWVCAIKSHIQSPEVWNDSVLLKSSEVGHFSGHCGSQWRWFCFCLRNYVDHMSVSVTEN